MITASVMKELRYLRKIDEKKLMMLKDILENHKVIFIGKILNSEKIKLDNKEVIMVDDETTKVSKTFFSDINNLNVLQYLSNDLLSYYYSLSEYYWPDH